MFQVLFNLFFFYFLNNLFLASSPTPSEKENSTILAHMHMSLRNQELRHPAMLTGTQETKAGQFPPSMQYMGMSHFQNWQLTAH
jgi:hypothetical protein